MDKEAVDSSKNSTIGNAYLQLLQWTIPALIEKAEELKFAKENRIDLWLVLLYASILELANSACRLISSTEQAGCRTLTRMALEAYVDLANLASDDDYVNYLDFGSLKEWQETFRLAKSGNTYFESLCDEPGFDEEVASEAERLASLRDGGYRKLYVKERFERANMADDYHGVYHWLCSDTHNSLRGLSLRHIEYLDDQSYAIHILKNEPVDAQLPIMNMLLGYMIKASKLVHARFGKGQDELQNIEAKVLATTEMH
jgi:hypothetical protein